VLLSYRLYRYRREFVRLVAVRNTTQSRFIRLFIICVIVILVYVPYTIWLLVSLSYQITDPYSWSRVHNPNRFNSIVKAPSFGVVTVDKWGQVATGYVLFFVFGTGSDAYNTYKKMLVVCGLGRIWPSLYILRESGASTPNSFINARTLTSSVTSKALNVFKSRSDSFAETWHGSTRHNSVAVGSIQRLSSITTAGPTSQPLFFGRVFGRKAQLSTVLPLFAHSQSRSKEEITVFGTHNSYNREQRPRVLAHAWAAEI
jgi:pheromone a factor receptor